MVLVKLHGAGQHHGLYPHLVREWLDGYFRIFSPCSHLSSPPNRAIHHDPLNFGPDPEAFRPERFEEENADFSGKWLPFSGGARNCLGTSFAMMEMKILLGLFVKNFTFSTAPDFTPTPISQGEGGGGGVVVVVGSRLFGGCLILIFRFSISSRHSASQGGHHRHTGVSRIGNVGPWFRLRLGEGPDHLCRARL